MVADDGAFRAPVVYHKGFRFFLYLYEFVVGLVFWFNSWLNENVCSDSFLWASCTGFLDVSGNL